MYSHAFGDTLRSIRTSRRLSQSALADSIACDHSYLSHMERGARLPSLEVLAAMVEAMNLSLFDQMRLFLAAMQAATECVEKE